jgi:predicted nucleic acid-binding protein
MKSIFLDSSFFKAVIDPDDDFYLQARNIWKSLIENNNPLVTTNYILDETYTLVRAKCDLNKALELRDVLSREQLNMSIVRVTVDDDAVAWDWFIKEWSKLSFTDCVSFAVMKRLGIKDVATFDNHFAKAGFRIVK